MSRCYVLSAQIEALLWTFYEKWTRLPQILGLDMRAHRRKVLRNQDFALRRLEAALALPLRCYERFRLTCAPNP
jgi:hypothetical protein